MKEFTVIIMLTLYCLKYFKTRGGGVITVVAETTTNRVTPVLSNSEPA